MPSHKDQIIAQIEKLKKELQKIKQEEKNKNKLSNSKAIRRRSAI
jgi:hypothetical protein